MIESRRSRLVALLVLFGGLAGVCVGFDATAMDPQHWTFPGADAIASNPTAYIGERVAVSGTVIRQNPVVIHAPYERVGNGRAETGILELTVTNPQRTVQVGRELRVYGVLRSPSTIRALDVVVVPAWHFLYMYVVSFLAGVWVLARLVRGWTVDWQRFAIQTRE